MVSSVRLPIQHVGTCSGGWRVASGPLQNWRNRARCRLRLHRNTFVCWSAQGWFTAPSAAALTSAGSSPARWPMHRSGSISINVTGANASMHSRLCFALTERSRNLMLKTVPTIILKRIIDAPVDQVFQAWTDPALIRRWLAPHPCEVHESSTDARPGGLYSITVADLGGKMHTTSGEYLEVVTNRRLVKTWVYDGPYGRDETPTILTVDFRELRPGVTELILTHAQFGDEESRKGTAAGWVLCLDQLTHLFDQPVQIEDVRNMHRRDFIKYGKGATALTLLALCTSARQEDKQKKQITGEKRTSMKIKVTSVMVDNQDKALKFYTEVLGFVKKTEIPLGPSRWLTVVSPEEPNGTELLLEPLGFPPARTFQKALFEAGIPWTQFVVDDIQKEYDRLQKLGVVFRGKPMKAGTATV